MAPLEPSSFCRAVIPAQAVREFLAGTEAKGDQPSNFNHAWQAGLREFFADFRRGELVTEEGEVDDVVRHAPAVPR